MLDKITDTLQQQLDKAKETVEIVYGKVSEIKDAGMDKIKSYMDEISNGLPVFEEAGFHLDGISIGLGIPPDISIAFSKTKEVSAETIKALIHQNADKKSLSLILNTLLTANTLQNKIRLNKLIFAGVSIQLGVPPKVSLKYC